MPRSNPGRIPLLRHHRPTGRAVVTLNGRDYPCGPYGTPAAIHRYNVLIARWLEAGRESLHPAECPSAEPVELQLSDLAATFDRHARAYYSSNGERTHEADCLKGAIAPALSLFGQTATKDFGPMRLKAVRDAMIGKGWSRPHINRQVTNIRRMFAWGVENELIPGEVLYRRRTLAIPNALGRE